MTQQLMEIARASVLEEMASGIAHELNQPLGAIATFAQTGERMLDRPEPMITEARELFRHISDQAMGAGAGIRTIRRLFNNDVSNMQRLPIGDIIDHVAPLLHAVAHRAGGDVSIEVMPSLPDVLADSLRIQHVLLTLIQNAVDASTQMPLVRLEAEGNQYGVEVSIIDQGCGIPEQARANIFRPFYTTKAHGTGLGLASARAIVEAHEGAIGFQNAPGGGTRFWFKLPAAA
jgi:C4-dicarboxylate-specific signal transduction histidine kinase